MKYGILRAACASPALTVADCGHNADEIISCIRAADAAGVRVLVLPELCVTGYTCGDLFLQRSLQQAAVDALERIAREAEGTQVLAAVGLPVRLYDALYNCAAWVHRGRIVAIIPKTFIPTYGEFYERRWFAPASPKLNEAIRLSEEYDEVPFGTDILIQDKDDPLIKIGTEICEDLWAPASPSVRHALAGATIIANLSASNEAAGKADYRRLLTAAHSAKTVTAYLYADAGHDESTTDMVFGGHNIIALNGAVLAESRPFAGGGLLAADIDLERIAQDRARTGTFKACAEGTLEDPYGGYHAEEVELAENEFAGGDGRPSIGFDPAAAAPRGTGGRLLGGVDAHPFVPAGQKERGERCRAVIEMQAEGLAKRLRHTGAAGAVIGLSGGLDSTLALLVTARAFDKCGRGRQGITAVTMPCFGTTDRTYRNACALARAAGATLREVRIEAAVRQHFADIGHDEAVRDVVYENSQARERTQVLMDVANKDGSLVIGTGDLSELALGWCTYNGDQMSMYGVNASIPKTLVRHLVEWFAGEADAAGQGERAAVLRDILATPVSPELLPPEGGSISQKTEELVGPYELHDFFLYYMLRWGFGPGKILFLAEQAFAGAYSRADIAGWLRMFYRRFFSQQFKRSCMPDGAKVGTVSLSPRGDWRMPSDAGAALWLAELDGLEA